MREKNHYFRIGLFLVIGTVLMIVAIVIFGAGELFDKSIQLETYFDESVQGLDVGSFVKYRGVSVGKVKNITVVTDKYDFGDNEQANDLYNQYVMVEIDLDARLFGRLKDEQDLGSTLSRLISNEGLRIKIGYLGITGLLYLEIDYVDPKENPPLLITWTPETFYIPSVPSPIIRIEQAVTTFSREFENEFLPLLQNLNHASEKLMPILDNFKVASDDFPSITEDLKASLNHVNNLMTVEKDSISELIENLRVVSEELKDFSLELNQNPSRVLFGKPPRKLDVPR